VHEQGTPSDPNTDGLTANVQSATSSILGGSMTKIGANMRRGKTASETHELDKQAQPTHDG
jgi:hypothetical protein